MRGQIIQTVIIFTFLLLLSTTTAANAAVPTTSLQRQQSRVNPADFPTVDPGYIYDQLFFMVTHFQRREAGYSAASSPGNGHDAFATYWANEIAQDLTGFGAQVQHDSFPIKGWQDRPAEVPAFNVEVSVPGATHPEQVVVIGCHYDGEAISTQSANDDASGCAIELGVARAMGNYWRNHHTYPARTLRFVIFDAEEQGLFGSFHYLNNTVNGDTHNIVAMFNEEQNGIAYPLRYLGRLSNPLLPFYIYMSPLTNSQLYPAQAKLSAAQRASIINFRKLMQQAVPAAFQQFQALGFQGLTYHGANRQDVAQPVFGSDQLNNIKQADDKLGGSDQIAFTLAGIPCATFVGNSTYYDHNPPAWSYPFDQQQDTIQLMNTFAQGGSQKSNALMLALALPGMLTSWMLNQPSILGQSATGDLPQEVPIAAISDIGQTRVGQNLILNARTAFDPTGKNKALTYNWNFGDGTQASGIEVHHTYRATGTYTLTLTVDAGNRTSRISKNLNVTEQATNYYNVYGNYPSNGNPPHNPQVKLPAPDDTLQDKVIGPAASLITTPTGVTVQKPAGTVTKGATEIPFALIVGTVVFLALIIGIGVVFKKNRAKHRDLKEK